jgi:hypothetical protein
MIGWAFIFVIDIKVGIGFYQVFTFAVPLAFFSKPYAPVSLKENS